MYKRFEQLYLSGSAHFAGTRILSESGHRGGLVRKLDLSLLRGPFDSLDNPVYIAFVLESRLFQRRIKHRLFEQISKDLQIFPLVKKPGFRQTQVLADP